MAETLERAQALTLATIGISEVALAEVVLDTAAEVEEVQVEITAMPATPLGEAEVEVMLSMEQ